MQTGSKPETPQPNVHAGAQTPGLSPLFWGLLALTGAGAGLGGIAFMELLHLVQHLAWSYHKGSFLDAVLQTSPLHRVLTLACGGVVAALGILLLRSVRGHGGEVCETIWFQAGKFPFVRTISSAALSIVLVSLGAAVGREGAPKQAGAAIASKLSDWARLSASQRRLLAACGAGAGMAAVYNVPFGGALFALEVLLGSLALPLVLPALAASLIATVVSWVALPNRPTYATPVYHVSASMVVWAVVFGPLAGLAGKGYIRAITWADHNRPQAWRRWALPIAVFTALGCSAILYPQLLGNGKDDVQSVVLDQWGLRLLAPLMVLRLAATAGCLRSGAPGGLFTPTITVGALLGAVCGHLWTFLWPSANTGAFAMIGAGALLAAATQGPVSSMVLLLELSNRADALAVPLMLAVTGATLVTRRLNAHSIYSARLFLRRLEVAKQNRTSATAFPGLISDRYTAVSTADRYAAILERRVLHPDWPVFAVDEEGALAGKIDLNGLNPAGLTEPLETTTAGDLATEVKPLLATSSEAEAKRRLDDSKDGQLPVVDPQTRRLAGVASLRRNAAERSSGPLTPSV